jgi:AraC-like DNA-binding protein
MSTTAVEASSFGLACQRGATRGMSIAHRHDDLEFNHADVDLEYVIDGRSHLIEAGTVAVFWAARPHQLVGGSAPGVETWLTVPLQCALAWRLPAGYLTRMLGGEVAGTPAAPGIRLDRLADRWAAELGGSALERRIAETEIEAFALRVASSVAEFAPQDPEAPGPADAPRAAAAAMAAFVSENSGADITVADVAAHVHLNPQYAMVVFRRSLGITIGDYLAQCRVAAAQQLLLTTDRSVPDIGFAAGFRSQSQFYDRFTRWCGQSPGVYRRRLTSL